MSTIDIRTGRFSQEQLSANFSDYHPPLKSGNAIVEANRCYFCYDAPCIGACPTNIDIPNFIRKIFRNFFLRQSSGTDINSGHVLLFVSSAIILILRILPVQSIIAMRLSHHKSPDDDHGKTATDYEFHGLRPFPCRVPANRHCDHQVALQFFHAD